jgi:signal transduction histidine kinase
METNSPVNILLVDDHPEGLITLEAVLKSPDYNLIKARSGEEALSYLSDYDIAVILLDVQMPKMDGFQTTAMIKQNTQWKDIPILFVTAIHKDTPYIHEGYKLGAVDYIFKPFDPYVVWSKVAVLVDLHRKTRRIQETQAELRHKDEELHQARKLEAIGRLAGGVAHDFNNLIAGILGISQEVRETFDSSDPRRVELDEIIKTAQRAFSLTRQLLSYARRQIITPQWLNLNEVIADMQGMLERLIGEHIELETALDPALGSVNADRGYLEQVMINLVVNSRDALPKGGKITIKTANVELDEKTLHAQRLHQLLPGSFVRLLVADTGSGMTPEVLEHIFEPFYTTKEQDKGTGLGLATVYGIVRQIGGDIAVQSQPDEGTVLEIYIPRVASRIATSANGTALPAPRGSETILVVEDEELVRRVVVNLLRKTGYTVLEAPNGPAALKVSGDYIGKINLLVTDVIMPGMNGRQLAHDLTTQRPEIAVLYMSGYTDDIVARQGILEPGIDFIDKAAVSSHLTGKVRQVLTEPAAPK